MYISAWMCVCVWESHLLLERKNELFDFEKFHQNVDFQQISAQFTHFEMVTKYHDVNFKENWEIKAKITNLIQ